jgi:hypothetical protein
MASVRSVKLTRSKRCSLPRSSLLTQKGVLPLQQPDVRDVERAPPHHLQAGRIGPFDTNVAPDRLTARVRVRTRCQAADRECPNVRALASQGSTGARGVGR